MLLGQQYKIEQKAFCLHLATSSDYNLKSAT